MKKWKITGQGQILAIGIILLLAYKIITNFENIWVAFGELLSILGPFFAGILIAFFLYRPVKKLDRLLERCKFRLIQKYSLLSSTLFVYAIIILVLVLTIKYVIPILFANIEDFIINIPKYYSILETFLEERELLQHLNLPQFLNDNLMKKINLSTLNQYLGLLSRVANYFLSAFMSIIFSIYIILEKDDMFSFIKSAFRVENPPAILVMHYAKKTVNLFHSYFSGLFLDATIIGITSFLLLSGFQVPYAPLMGVIIAIGNMIPFFGPIVSTSTVFIVSLLTIGPLRSIWVMIALFVIAQLDANVLQPKILGNSVGVSPLLVLLSVTVFGGLFGAVGMFLGVPVVAALKIVIMDYLDDRKLNNSQERACGSEK